MLHLFLVWLVRADYEQHAIRILRTPPLESGSSSAAAACGVMQKRAAPGVHADVPVRFSKGCALLQARQTFPPLDLHLGQHWPEARMLRRARHIPELYCSTLARGQHMADILNTETGPIPISFML